MVGGLRIIDVSDPTGPIELGHYDTPGVAQGVEVHGNDAFIATGGLLVLDVTDPPLPVEIAYQPQCRMGVRM